MSRVVPAVLALVLVLAPAARAAKTDVVVMRNGDHLTCEIKKLERSMLTVKTDDMGTIQIKWDKIAHLSSVNWYLVRTSEGFLHFGHLPADTTAGRLVIQGPSRRTEIDLAAVTGIERIKKSTWDKIEMAASFGLDYTRATEILKLLFETRIDYRGRNHRLGGSLLLDLTDNAGETRRRYDLSFSYRRLVSGRLDGFGSLGARRHDELGLQLRLQAGGGLGYRFVETRSSELTALAGAFINREWSLSGSADSSTEGLVGAEYSIFAYDTPKTDIKLRVAAMPSFTVSERVRSEIEIRARRELVKDLYLVLSYYESRDNRPPDGASAKVDRGVVFAVEWTK